MALDDLKDVTIHALYLSEEKNIFKFNTDKGKFIFEIEPDCCNKGWIEHISGIDNLINHKILEVDNVEMGRIIGNKEEDDVLESLCLKLKTDIGYVDIEYRNSHNGYYGVSLIQLNDKNDKEYTKTCHLNRMKEIAKEEKFKRVAKDF